MVSFFQRIDYWLQSIFVVEQPVNIQQVISEEELVALYQQFKEDEMGLTQSIRLILEERLTEKVTDKDINYCIRWAKRLAMVYS